MNDLLAGRHVYYSSPEKGFQKVIWDSETSYGIFFFSATSIKKFVLSFIHSFIEARVERSLYTGSVGDMDLTS